MADARRTSINPNLPRAKRPQTLSVEAYVDGICAGDRAVLSRAITLIESTRAEHQGLARDILERCLPRTGGALRIGITGVPGGGKSTFIEALGRRLTAEDHRLAVLAIDPTSTRTRGSILGDKTRMRELASDPQAFIRPSPTAGSLGGVARRTHETMLLCEAAGYDVVLVETVGVGQAEVTVHSMVDVFLLLALAGAGDALQGIKRGIMEMVDVLAITKADGANRPAAEAARQEYEQALRLFPEAESGWRPRVLTCSAQTGEGLDAVWQAVLDYVDHAKANGTFAKRRQQQARFWMHQTIEHQLRDRFFSHRGVRRALPAVEEDVVEGRLSSFAAAEHLLSIYQEDSERSAAHEDQST